MASVGGGDGLRGQALVEFALALIVFSMLLLGIFDFGRGIYTYNGLAQAAREIARAEVVNQTGTPGGSTETQGTIATQKALVPGLRVLPFECVDITGAATPSATCPSGNYIRVTVEATYKPVSPLGIAGPFTFKSASSIQVP